MGMGGPGAGNGHLHFTKGHANLADRSSPPALPDAPFRARACGNGQIMVSGFRGTLAPSSAHQSSVAHTSEGADKGGLETQGVTHLCFAISWELGPLSMGPLLPSHRLISRNGVW